MIHIISIEVGAYSLNVFPEHLNAKVGDAIVLAYRSKNIDDRQATLKLHFKESAPFEKRSFNLQPPGELLRFELGVVSRKGDHKYDVTFLSKDFKIDVDPYIHVH
jgi:hypothetical protein